MKNTILRELLLFFTLIIKKYFIYDYTYYFLCSVKVKNDPSLFLNFPRINMARL